MASEGRVPNNQIVSQRCADCLGQGYIVVYRCSECGVGIEAGQSAGEESKATIPCTHAAESYVAVEIVCGTCNGAGRVHRGVGKADFDAIRRRRLSRGAVLFVLALIPLLALGWAVLSNEPATICGSWWYGAMFPVMLVTHRLWHK